jgi:sec-independent protein translocase protein TatC
MPTIREHLKELRNKFFFIIITGVILFFIIFFNSGNIINFILSSFNITASILAPLEYINTQINISIFLTLTILIPLIFYNLYKYLEDIFSREIKFGLALFVFTCLLLLIMGIVFAIFIFLPFSFTFFKDVPITINSMWSLESVIRYVSFCLFAFALIFQIPLLMYFLDKIGLVPRKFLSKFRILVLLIIYILAGLVTPGVDLYSQSVMAIPTYILFESGLLICLLNKEDKMIEYKNPDDFYKQYKKCKHLNTTKYFKYYGSYNKEGLSK